MRKVLISWRGFDIPSYPAMLYLGLLAGIFAGAHIAQRAGLSADRFATAMLILTIPALVGSRLLFVWLRWDLYRRDWSRIWRRSEGGMAMYGGLLASVPLSVPLLYVMQLEFGAFWDAATITMLVGMIFARVGCFLHGCCAGRPTSAWIGMDLPNHQGIWQRRIPTQILEMVWAAALLGAALLLWDRRPFAGAIFGSAVVAYGAGRFLLEPLRECEPGNVSANLRVASLVLVVVAFAGLVLAWAR